MIALISVALVTVLHFGFMLLEMFFWHRALGRRIFRHSLENARTSRTLAMNQGFYNGLLASGLLASFFLTDHSALVLRLYILSAIIAAGLFGAWTVNVRILFIQAIPAVIALLSILYF